MIMATLN